MVPCYSHRHLFFQLGVLFGSLLPVVVLKAALGSVKCLYFDIYDIQVAYMCTAVVPKRKQWTEDNPHGIEVRGVGQDDLTLFTL